VIASGRFTQHMAINAAKLVTMRDNPKLREIVDTCGLVNADGQSIVWASRLLGDPLPARVAGIDLMQALLELAERRGYRVYFLGARADVLERAIERIHRLHPRLEIVGARNGYFSEHEDLAVSLAIRATRPDIVFVAISSPRKEYFLGEHGFSVCSRSRGECSAATPSRTRVSHGLSVQRYSTGENASELWLPLSGPPEGALSSAPGLQHPPEVIRAVTWIEFGEASGRWPRRQAGK
jgi:exopolysaccharide biosynthesis WecB/TagA/CpsF family protein